MKNILYFYFLVFCTFLSCQNELIKKEKSHGKCTYFLEDLLSLKKENITFKLLNKDSFKIIDETKNGIGNIYIFNQKNELIEYRFMNSSKSYSYSEDFINSTAKGNPLVYYEFVESKDVNKKIMLYLYYFSLFKEYDLYLCKGEKSKKLHYEKSNDLSNMFYSSVLLNKYTKEDLNKIRYTIKGSIINCDNKKIIINEEISPFGL